VVLDVGCVPRERPCRVLFLSFDCGGVFEGVVVLGVVGRLGLGRLGMVVGLLLGRLLGMVLRLLLLLGRMVLLLCLLLDDSTLGLVHGSGSAHHRPVGVKLLRLPPQNVLLLLLLLRGLLLLGKGRRLRSGRIQSPHLTEILSFGSAASHR